jgi:dsDNA-binding SOS-regulon protein
MATNTNSRQDQILDRASTAPSFDELLEIIDDLDAQLTEAKAELDDANEQIRALKDGRP